MTSPQNASGGSPARVGPFREMSVREEVRADGTAVVCIDLPERALPFPSLAGPSSDVCRRLLLHFAGRSAASDVEPQSLSPAGLSAKLSAAGIPSRVDRAYSLEDLAQQIEHGRGVIALVNLGFLRGDATTLDSGEANHAVLVLGVVRERQSMTLLEASIFDPGSSALARLVPSAELERCWLDAGGELVIADLG